MCIKEIINTPRIILLLLAMLIMAAGCIKSSDSLIPASTSLTFDKGNLKKALEGVDSLRLFYQALSRAGYAGMLETNNSYTLFAPGNTAMQAAGLNAEKIRQLSPDSLRKIVSYHMLSGGYDDNAFQALLITSFMPTLKIDTVLVPTQKFITQTAYLSIQKGDQLYINSYAVAGNTPPVMASNGFIYPVGRVMNTAPVDERKTMWDVIQTDPELSMYRDAVILLDSIKESDAYFDGILFFTVISPPVDVPLLSERKTNPANGTSNNKSIPTVFAPTNQAFNDAGFHSIDDLRAFAYRYPFGVTVTANDDYSEVMFTYRFSSLDTLLARSILTHGDGDGALRYPARMLYGDLVKGKINNGVFNRMARATYERLASYVKYPFDLYFTAQNGIAYVQWRNNPEKIMIPKDADPLHPVNNYNLDNGVMYKVGKLFYPFN
jgi:uncharacterized surface protein with fasciclin (FAS1) repeats